MTDDLTPDLTPPPGEVGAVPAEDPNAAPPTPEPRYYPYQVRDERFDLPADHVDVLAQTLKRDPQDLIRALQIDRDSSRIYQEHRQRERKLAETEASIAQQRRELESALQEIRGRQNQLPDVEFVDPSVRAVYERLGSLEKTVTTALQSITEREQAREEETRQESQLWDSYETLMADKQERGYPTVPPKQFFATMGELGLGNSMIPFDVASEIVYRYLLPDLQPERPTAVARFQAPPRPAADPNLRNPRAQIVVPSRGAGPGPSYNPTQPRPGETLEQRRDRLMAELNSLSPSGKLKWGDIPPES